MREYKVKTIRALDRGLEVLDFLHKARSASLHDLHLATGLPKATLTRMVVTLEKRNLLWQRVEDGAYMASHTFQPRPSQMNDENFLVETASPVMERLCKKVNWPSILAVPRLDYMEVIETNRPKSYFSHIPIGPIGFRINMLRSASGRTYLAFCSESERAAVLQRLVASEDPGNYLAHRPSMIKKLIAETQKLGYGVRATDFGGHFDKTRRESDDGRDSIAVPIWAGTEVVAAINLTWMHKAATVEQIVKSHLASVKEASQEITEKLMAQ
ncbi:MAG: helix-turn-helix domain-containing protein [Burkholderiales bacterium]|nr:helix-turn-helix domain-containing protein [Burkholderiales bacterium]